MSRTHTPWGIWDPLGPAEVHRIFGALTVPWWLAGGYAIELATGRRLREHADIDVLMLRRDHVAAQDALAGWEWWAADPPGVLRPWRVGEFLPANVHDVWCRPAAGQPWRVQLMVDESDGADWVSRRDPRVRRPISSLLHTTVDGGRCLSPEIQLFYKAKTVRDKDEIDFTAVLPLLDGHQRRWLAKSINDAYGAHPWLGRLGVPGPPGADG